MAQKNKFQRINEREQDIAAAEQRIQVEEAKISAARKRINAEKQRIRGWKEEICNCEAALLAEKFRASNISLEVALSALDHQSGQQCSSGEEAP